MRALAVAVLQQAVEDSRGTGAEAAQARAWLQGDSRTLRHWCACAGIGDVSVLHRWLRRPDRGLAPPWPLRRFDENDEAA